MNNINENSHSKSKIQDIRIRKYTRFGDCITVPTRLPELGIDGLANYIIDNILNLDLYRESINIIALDNSEFQYAFIVWQKIESYMKLLVGIREINFTLWDDHNQVPKCDLLKANLILYFSNDDNVSAVNEFVMKNIYRVSQVKVPPTYLSITIQDKVISEDGVNIKPVKLKEGHILRHFKGNLYIVMHIAKHTETGEELVVYRRYNPADGHIWVRPLKMFYDIVSSDSDTDNFHRFEVVDILL